MRMYTYCCLGKARDTELNCTEIITEAAKSANPVTL